VGRQELKSLPSTIKRLLSDWQLTQRKCKNTRPCDKELAAGRDGTGAVATLSQSSGKRREAKASKASKHAQPSYSTSSPTRSNSCNTTPPSRTPYLLHARLRRVSPTLTLSLPLHSTCAAAFAALPPLPVRSLSPRLHDRHLHHRRTPTLGVPPPVKCELFLHAHPPPP